MYFFDSKEHQQKLRTVLEEWKNTPYKHRCAVKGAGADCIFFIGAVLIEVGAVPKNVMKGIPDYPHDWHLHKTDEVLLNEITKRLPVEPFDVSVQAPVNGDLLVYKFAKAHSHSSIFCDGHVHQALMGLGVVQWSFLHKQWYKRLRKGFRIRAVA
jgi:cell wall-associated NlpC family hydrolase